MGKRLLFFTKGLILYSALLSCSDSGFRIDTDLLDESKCYLLFRGTNTKEGIIAEDFNLFNSGSSHVGLCIYQDSQWTVYHVLNPKLKNDTALIRENMDNFYDISGESMYYAGLWVVNDLSESEYSEVFKVLHEYESASIKFDLTFASNDPANLYCSKFICEVLKKVNEEKFSFITSKTKLKPLYSMFLRADTLSYYPVDIFQCNENFSLLKEWIFER